ncbi:hypothetical protein CANCADRAFT_4039 [Tortispora caseinolytica NRRL Y-17796]|uniref:Rad26-like helical repeats domain-containing protein n=1 Tax=Tortispora caseinolytica NRRL Y-17796 TaxID=767744 RepID=A0A1E4TCC8_9ASCO|nr:hypothetical protein CANCADRAFT_4039 [Tortispora caseinolytica NRRL Y-17796]
MGQEDNFDDLDDLSDSDVVNINVPVVQYEPSTQQRLEAALGEVRIVRSILDRQRQAHEKELQELRNQVKSTDEAKSSKVAELQSELDRLKTELVFIQNEAQLSKHSFDHQKRGKPAPAQSVQASIPHSTASVSRSPEAKRSSEWALRDGFEGLAFPVTPRKPIKRKRDSMNGDSFQSKLTSPRSNSKTSVPESTSVPIPTNVAKTIDNRYIIAEIVLHYPGDGDGKLLIDVLADSPVPEARDLALALTTSSPDSFSMISGIFRSGICVLKLPPRLPVLEYQKSILGFMRKLAILDVIAVMESCGPELVAACRHLIEQHCIEIDDLQQDTPYVTEIKRELGTKAFELLGIVAHGIREDENLIIQFWKAYTLSFAEKTLSNQLSIATTRESVIVLATGIISQGLGEPDLEFKTRSGLESRIILRLVKILADSVRYLRPEEVLTLLNLRLEVLEVLGYILQYMGPNSLGMNTSVVSRLVRGIAAHYEIMIQYRNGNQELAAVAGKITDVSVRLLYYLRTLCPQAPLASNRRMRQTHNENLLVMARIGLCEKAGEFISSTAIAQARDMLEASMTMDEADALDECMK